MDVYSATAFAGLIPAAAQASIVPFARRAFDALSEELRPLVSDSLLEHRELMFERHLDPAAQAATARPSP